MQIAGDKCSSGESESLVNYEIWYRGEVFAVMLMPKHTVRPSVKLSSNAKSFRDEKERKDMTKRIIVFLDLPPKLPHAVGLTNRAKIWSVKRHILDAESNSNEVGEGEQTFYRLI